MLLKTKGIVLRSFKYSETSLIVEIYTAEKGLKKYIVSGVRKKNAKISANLLQVMSIVDIVAYDKVNRDLNRIKELRSAHIFQQLPFDIRRSSVGLFITEVAHKMLRESEENRTLFDFIEQIFLHLDQSSNAINNIHIYFLIHFTRHLGFLPDGQYSETTPFFNLQEGIFTNNDAVKYHLNKTMSQFLDQFLDISLSDLHTIIINRSDRNMLVEKMLQYYQLHIDNFPQISAHTILKDVLS